MIEMTDKEQGICALLRKCLEPHSFYDSASHIVYAREHENGVSIAYQTSLESIPTNSTRFDIILQGAVCFIQYIERDRTDYGKGYGRMMVHAIENFCKAYGVKRIQATPSGGKNKDGRPLFWKSLGFERFAEREVAKFL